MAIHSAVPPPPQHASSTAHPAPTTAVPINVEAWAASALASMSIGTTGAPLSNPIDGDEKPREGKLKLPSRIKKAADDVDASDGAAMAGMSTSRRQRQFIRDSQRTRQALLKGREGTRARQRWENGI